MKDRKAQTWVISVATIVVLTTIALRLPITIRAQNPIPGQGKSENRVLPSPSSPTPKPEVPAPIAVDDFSVSLTPEMEATLPKLDDIKPLPDVVIPNDPPPHEGAMIDLPYRVEPPDHVLVEVLEALAGRPIAGERLVRPDGTITLGFYGDLHVRGLTREQIKLKLILHLRQYLSDEALGLLGNVAEEDHAVAPVPPAPANPIDRGEVKPPPLPPETSPFDNPPRPAPSEGKTPKSGNSSGRDDRGGGRFRLTRYAQNPAPSPPVVNPRIKAEGDVKHPAAAAPAERPKANNLRDGQGRIFIPPIDSDRVFVDVASYNGHVYYVLGDFGSPGRVPWTGNETVLDAIQYGAGLVDSAEPRSLRLVRPSRGKSPARVYPIDLEAIQSRGDVRANLQILPGDRLIVGRKASVERTVRLNEIAASTATILNHLLTYAYVMKNLGGLETLAVDPVRRKEILKAWSELFSNDPAMRDEVLKLIK